MKFILFLISLTSLTFILSSCSANDIAFNDKDVKFNLISSQKDFGNQIYDIEVQNTGKSEIGYLNLYIEYPIKQSNGSRSNPFKVEGKTNEVTPIKLKTNEKIIFHVTAPIEQVFGKSTLLDFENPSIEFNGFVLEGNKEIPFELGGTLTLILKDH